MSRRRGAEPARASAWGRVRLFSFLLQGISQLMPQNDKGVRNLLSLPPRGKVDCRSIAKARRMRGKRRYVYYRDSIPLIRHAVRFARTRATFPLGGRH